MKATTLLSKDNFKTIKGEKRGYQTFIMYLSPYNQNSKGINLCSHATVGCINSCLFNSGNGGMFTTVKQARINRTELFINNREQFFKQLIAEIQYNIVVSEINNMIPVFRLNGTSDIRFEKFKIKDGKNIFELFPNVMFYDYTKNHLRFNQTLPSNYTLVLSRSESNEDIALDILKDKTKNTNVAIVFDKIPTTYKGFEVINGDEDDLRFLDKKNVIVGLRFKKDTRKGANNKELLKSDFIVKVAA